MEKILLILDISKTHLLAKKKQTLVAALGVTFGIGMFIQESLVAATTVWKWSPDCEKLT